MSNDPTQSGSIYPIFRTTDGYTLYLTGEGWVDNLDPELRDLLFTAGKNGMPVDDFGEELEGEVVMSQEEDQPTDSDF